MGNAYIILVFNYSRGRVALGHPYGAVIGEPINGQSNGAKQFDVLYIIMWVRDDRLVIPGNFEIPVFLYRI